MKRRQRDPDEHAPTGPPGLPPPPFPVGPPADRFLPPPPGPPQFPPTPGPPQFPPPTPAPWVPPTPVVWNPAVTRAEEIALEIEQSRKRRKSDHRRKNLAILTSFFMLVAVCGGGIVLLSRDPAFHAVEGDFVVFSAGHESAPPLDVPGDGNTTPLGAPAPVLRQSPSYKVIWTQPDGRAVGWDPCKPVHYVVNTEEQPSGGDSYLNDAIAKVSRATGLQFVYDGPTDERLVNDRHLIEGDGDTRRWAPVLISWSSPGRFPPLAGDVLGLAIPRAMSVGADRSTLRITTGLVALDGPQLGAFGSDMQGVIEHELAHLVGLDHVNDAGQLMYPSTDFSVDDYQDGDLTGLAALGQAQCFAS